MLEPTLGTVSHGTMRPEDLIPAFIEELRTIEHPKADSFAAEYDALQDAPDCDHEAEVSLLEDLFAALEECAPEGCYFGAHEGDGSDYGFWPVAD